jgi:outer membrane receptor protein involved in Fe transport
VAHLRVTNDPSLCRNFSRGIQTGFLKHFGLSFNSRYVSSQYAINDTLNITPPVKPYVLVDSKLTYQLKDVEIFFALNNIFNEKYNSFVSKAISSTSQDFYPAPERNIRAGLNIRF